MKIVLHMGTPKTGSTSLQTGLGKIRQLLLNDGFYYPESHENYNSDFHHLMLAFFENPEVLKPQHMKQFGSMDNVICAARRFLSNAKKQAYHLGII